MPSDPLYPDRKPPIPGDAFNPRRVFRGIGALVPERVAASTELSMTAKLCYGHLVRRAGERDQCWPSIRDIAQHIGVSERHAMRALEELKDAELIRSAPRNDPSGRQTSNVYEFTWGPILQREGDKSDTLLPVKTDRGRASNLTRSGVSQTAPLESSIRNQHRRTSTERNHRIPDAPTLPDTPIGSASNQRSTHKASSQELPTDDLEQQVYASGKEEVKAIASRAGVSFRARDLDEIESHLISKGVSWEHFASEARTHSWGRIKNPIGFLKSLAKRFKLLTRPATAPVTAAEAVDQNYQCPTCNSRVKGEGAILIDGKFQPCPCASQDYIDRQRARGLFE